jgi:hypothetical protein
MASSVAPREECARAGLVLALRGLLHGQLVKRRQNHQVKTSITRMLWGKRPQGCFETRLHIVYKVKTSI